MLSQADDVSNEMEFSGKSVFLFNHKYILCSFLDSEDDMDVDEPSLFMDTSP